MSEMYCVLFNYRRSTRIKVNKTKTKMIEIQTISLTVFTLNSTVSWLTKTNKISIMILGTFSVVHTRRIANYLCKLIFICYRQNVNSTFLGLQNSFLILVQYTFSYYHFHNDLRYILVHKHIVLDYLHQLNMFRRSNMDSHDMDRLKSINFVSKLFFNMTIREY